MAIFGFDLENEGYQFVLETENWNPWFLVAECGKKITEKKV